MVPACQLWWCLECWAIHLQDASSEHDEASRQVMLRARWKRYSEVCEAILPIDCALRKEIDASGKTKYWNRLSPTHSASTAGVLVLLCHHATAGSVERRPEFCELFRVFLQCFLSEEYTTLPIVFDREIADMIFPGQPESHDVIDLPVDRGNAQVEALWSEVERHDAVYIKRSLRACCSKYNVSTST